MHGFVRVLWLAGVGEAMNVVVFFLCLGKNRGLTLFNISSAGVGAYLVDWGRFCEDGVVETVPPGKLRCRRRTQLS